MNLDQKPIKEPFPGFQTISEAAVRFGENTHNLSYKDFIKAVVGGQLGKKVQKIAKENPLGPVDPLPDFRARIERALKLGLRRENKFRHRSL